MLATTGTSLLTTTFDIKSPITNYFLNLTFEDNPNQAITKSPYSSMNEVVMIVIGPGSFYLEDYQTTGTFYAEGLTLTLFTDNENKSMLFYNEIIGRKYLDLTQVFSLKPFQLKNSSCPVNYLNNTVAINASLDLTAGRIEVFVNGSLCVSKSFDTTDFHDNKTSISLMTRQTTNTGVTLWVDEISIYKHFDLEAEHGSHFTHSMQKLSETVHKKDRHYRKNVSIANTFINGVD